MANKQVQKRIKAIRIRKRVRKNMLGTCEVPRLSVFRSLKNISVQIIDDESGKTLISCSSLDRDVRALVEKSKKKKDLSSIVGAQIAKKALDKDIKQVIFDRNRYVYHGRVKEVAESARKAGLKI